MTLYTLIRHGRAKLSTYAALNPAGRSLCEQGRRQAAIVGEVLAERGVDALIASDMARARETAEIIAEGAGLAPIELSAHLRECQPELPPDHPQRASSSAQSIRAAEEAAAAAFDELLIPRGADRHVALVGHGNTLRYLLAGAMGAAPQWLSFALMFHCSTSTLALRSNGRFQLLCYNDGHRLPEELRTTENLNDIEDSGDP